MGKENAAKLERMVLLKQKSWARDEDQKRELAAVSGLWGSAWEVWVHTVDVHGSCRKHAGMAREDRP